VIVCAGAALASLLFLRRLEQAQDDRHRLEQQ
jgi:hypothetical protein